jgi:hypothetical protein
LTARPLLASLKKPKGEMPPNEIPGLKEEIEKGEFSSWSDDDLIQFMYEPGGSLPNLQYPTRHDLRRVAVIHEFKRWHIALATRNRR